MGIALFDGSVEKQRNAADGDLFCPLGRLGGHLDRDDAAGSPRPNDRRFGGEIGRRGAQIADVEFRRGVALLSRRLEGRPDRRAGTVIDQRRDDPALYHVRTGVRERVVVRERVSNVPLPLCFESDAETL